MNHPLLTNRTRWLLLVLLAFSAATVFAGTYGKIVGKAVDKKTGEALPLVNVILEGTTIGGSTDIEGRITIISVPPGTYSVRASLIGYATQVVTKVTVRADLTTNIQFEMTESAITIGTEVIVIGVNA